MFEKRGCIFQNVLIYASFVQNYNMPKSKIIYLILFLSLAYFPLFYNLDAWSLRKWDEARNAVGAVNMQNTGDYLVRLYNDKLDAWETKPPMLLWIQTLFMKVLGPTMWAIRLPSALATLFLMLAIIFFCGKTLDDWTAGFLSAFALLVSDGFIKAHVSRTGDHDALLTFFLILSIFYFYKWLKNKQLADILWAALWTFLAVMTKSIVGLMFLPGLFIYAVFSRQLGKILRGPAIYLAGLSLVLGIGFYYFLAEWTHAGYLKAVWQMELLPRFQNTGGKYIQPEAGHYLNLLVKNERFPFWYLLPFCVWAAWKMGHPDLKKFVGIPLSIGLVFSVIMSFGVWYDWYDAPLYPLWSLIFGCGLSAIFKKMTINGFKNQPKYWVVGFVFLGVGVLFSRAYYKVSKRIYENGTYQKPNEQYGEYVEKCLKMGQICDFSMLFSSIDPYDAPMQYYKKILHRKQQEVNLIYVNLKTDTLSNPHLGLLNRDSIAIGNRYLSCHTELTDTIKKHFKIRLLEQTGDCSLFQIEEKIR